MYDVLIIGAGVTGCAIARELTRYELSVCVAEKKEDVCSGTSKANSGIVHAGFDARPGTLKAKLNAEGNRRMEEVCRELDVPFKRNGSLVLCTALDGSPAPKDLKELERLKAQGEQNGVKGLRILGRDELFGLEPNLSENAAAALYAPTGGIVCPFTLTCAYAECAAANGAEFVFDTSVLDIKKGDGGVFSVFTNRGVLQAKTLVNAAGVHADVIHNMVSEEKIHITARKGEYCLFDHEAADLVKSTIFQLPTLMGKGVLVTPTVHGNLLMGPTAKDIDDKEGTDTTSKGLDEVLKAAAGSVRTVPKRQVITSFAGLRAHEDGDDFILGEAADVPGFFDAAGIESPGLSCAPVIGEMIAGMVAEKLNAKADPAFVPERTGIVQVHTLPLKERAKLIKERPEYGNIICRCEMISEGEILDAIRRTPGARSLDGVKRRTRAGMGRCQSGFCSPKVMEILNRELDLPMTKITKNGAGSELVYPGKSKKA